jgi:Carboxypeptidase regulatory-like domain/TonB dependent receptor
VRKTTLAVVFLWLVGAAVTGLAQVDTGTVVGTIKDASGAVVPNATATATNVDTGIKTAVKSASDGNYVITPVKIGRYSISAEAAGFRTEVRQNIVLDVQQTIRLDFSLRVGSVTETTNVTGDAPLLDTQDASLGDVVASQQIEQLPLNGRRYTDLATLTAGVTKITEGPVDGSSSPTNGNAGGNFSVNGTRGDQNNFILDGIDNNSNDNGDLAILSSVDAVAEFKIQTSNYSAEFGRSGGGVVNATTKSGTNQFHGSAWEFLRNEALDAAQYGFGTAQPKAPHKQNQFGVTVGGPIVKDKVFFFGDYEGTRIHSAQTDITTVPTQKETTGDFSDLLNPVVQTGLDGLGRPIYQGEIYNPATTRTAPNGSTVRDGFGFDVTTGQPIQGQANIIPGGMSQLGLNYAALYPVVTTPGGGNYSVNALGTNRVDQMDVRVDENVSSKMQLFERFSLSQSQRFQAPVFSGIADGGNYNTGNRPLTTRGFVLGSTNVISPTLVNSLRVGFNRSHYIANIPTYGQNQPPAGLQFPGVPNNPSVNGLTHFGFSGYQGLGEPLFTPTKSTSQVIQVSDTISYVRGRHLLKAGPQIRFDQFNLLQIAQPRGNVQFTGQFTAVDPGNQQGSGNAIADMLLGFPISARISTVTAFHNRQHSYGAFVTDTYKAAQNLTLDLGLRYDYATPFYEADNRESNFDYTTGKIIPAGTPGYPKNLANVDKADFAPRIGLSYNPFPSRPLVVRAGYGRFFIFNEIRTGDPLQLDYNLPFFFEPSFQSDGLTPAMTPGGTPVTLATGFPPLNPTQALSGVTSQDWRQHTGVYDEWNLDIEYQLPGNVLITPAYVGTKGTHLQSLVDRNQIPTPQPTFNQALRPYPQFGPFTSIENRGNSTYHAFQLKAEKRTGHGLYFLSAFTFSKSINDQPEICCNAPWPQNSYNLAAEKGLSDFDNRKRWVTSVDYALPVGKGQKFLDHGGPMDLAFGGWHLGGIITFRSGFPFSPQIGTGDPTNTGSQGLLRADRIGSGHVAHPSPSLWFNINDFPVPVGHFGDAGKNILEGPGEKGVDLSARKIFSIHERIRLEFRAEFFNAFNHAVFSQPDPFVTDGPGTAAVITSTVIPQRQIQFALKLEF